MALPFHNRQLRKSYIVLHYILSAIFCIVDLSSCGDEGYEENFSAEVVHKEPVRSGEPKTLTESQVAELLLDAGFSSYEVGPMICIAKYESAMRTNAVGRATHGRARGSRDIGLFQINAYYWVRSKSEGGCGIQESELFDAKANARCARIVFLRHGYNGWIAYKKNRRVCERYVVNVARSKLAYLNLPLS